MQESDRFRPDNGGASARRAKDFCDSWRGNIFSAGHFVRLLNEGSVRIFKRITWIDSGAKLAICEEAVSIWVNAGSHGRAIDVGGSEISRVMVQEVTPSRESFQSVGE